MEEEGLGLTRLISVHRDSRYHRAAKYLFPRVSKFLISPGCQKTSSPGFQNFLLPMAARTTSWTGIPGTALHRVSKLLLPQGFKIFVAQGCQKTPSPGFQNFLLHMAARTTSWTGIPGTALHRVSKFVLRQGFKISFCTGLPNVFFHRASKYFLPQHLFCNDPYKFWLSQGDENLLLQNIFCHMF